MTATTSTATSTAITSKTKGITVAGTTIAAISNNQNNKISLQLVKTSL